MSQSDSKLATAAEIGRKYESGGFMKFNNTMRILSLAVAVLFTSQAFSQELKLGDEDAAEAARGKVVIPEGRSRLMDTTSFKQMANVPAPAAACASPVIVEKKIAPKDFDKRVKALMASKTLKQMKGPQKAVFEKELRKSFADVVGKTAPIEQPKPAAAPVAAAPAPAPITPVIVAPAPAQPIAPPPPPIAPQQPASVQQVPPPPPPAAPAAAQQPAVVPVAPQAPKADVAPIQVPARQPVAPKLEDGNRKAEARIAEINKLIEDPKLPWTEFEKLLNERKELEKQVGKPKTVTY